MRAILEKAYVAQQSNVGRVDGGDLDQESEPLDLSKSLGVEKTRSWDTDKHPKNEAAGRGKLAKVGGSPLEHGFTLHHQVDCG